MDSSMRTDGRGPASPRIWIQDPVLRIQDPVLRIQFSGSSTWAGRGKAKMSGRSASTRGAGLLEDAVDVILRGGQTDAQGSRDLLVRHSLIDQRDDFRLSECQP